MAPTLYNQNPEPGDLIEIFRGPYEHWAVYVGDGYVVHLTAASDVPGSSSKNLSSVPNKNGLVYKEKLQDVVGTNMWRVNNILDNKYRPRPVDDIVKDACALVGIKVTYDVSSSNCEHFATGLLYGKPKSRQGRPRVLAGLGTLHDPSRRAARSVFGQGRLDIPAHTVGAVSQSPGYAVDNGWKKNSTFHVK
uniref:LRAT domain-containing protein n=1 Tax=Salarias fasciatus TaxID=181472 RepID=A0A672J3I2_SALFA